MLAMSERDVRRSPTKAWPWRATTIDRCIALLGVVALSAAIGCWLRAVTVDLGDGPGAAIRTFQLVRVSNAYALISVSAAACCAAFLGLRWLHR
jgi:hypothetical protein